MPFYRSPYNYKKFALRENLSLLEKALLANQVDEALYLSLTMYEFNYAQGYRVINDARLGRKWAGVCIKDGLCDFLLDFSLRCVGLGSLGSLPLVYSYVKELRDNNPHSFYSRVENLISLVCFLCAQPKNLLLFWKSKIKKEEPSMEKLSAILCTFADKDHEYRFRSLQHLTKQAWPLYLSIMEEDYMQTLHEIGTFDALLLATLSLLLTSRANYSFTAHEENRCTKECIESIFTYKIEDSNLSERISNLWII
ncbi:putative transmembrane protein [Cedratvirus kamchatka]|uniref:Transmembrane protein n=1 Tax=Cedratvirus kamchatka TaxID=2716914 RepID=A0A6G8MX64_9VIRU|nr:putative transmembrane protein [Cedratvirus kamchatka]